VQEVGAVNVPMSLNHAIDRSAKWLNVCNARIDGSPLDASTRKRVSATLLHLSLEHHGAIQLLISNKPHPHYGSAFALLRPEFEAYVRGVWFHRCASDQELADFTENDKLPSGGIDELIRAIETIPGYEDGLLKSTKKSTWKTMCDFTHGGRIQLVSRNSYTEISSNYTEEQIHELISAACSITLVVSVAFAALLDNNAMSNEILSSYKLLFSEEP
jgi:hypothetical protein